MGKSFQKKFCCHLFDYILNVVVFRRGQGDIYSTSNLFLIYVLCTVICKAFHAFLELSKLQGKKRGK